MRTDFFHPRLLSPLMKQVHPHLLSYILSGTLPLLHKTGLSPVRYALTAPFHF